MLSIRKSTANDLPAMLALYADARRFMAENGNPNQWVNGYPAREMLEADIASGNSYVCEEDGKVVGTFYFVIGDDPTYAVIEDGAWLDDEQYASHRPLAPVVWRAFVWTGATASTGTSASTPTRTTSPCRNVC